MRAIKTICIFGLIVGLSGIAPAAHAGSKAKMRDIRKLTKLMGADKMAYQLVDQLITALKGGYPNVPEKKWKKIRAQANVNAFINDVAKVYDKYLTHEEVKQLSAFFLSPVGRKFVSIQPKLFEESMKVGNAWGEKLTERISKELGQPK